MKRKRIAALAAALALILVPSMTVLAEDRKGASGWQVSFDGKKMESNFTTENISDEIIAMQPGDSVELTITLKNNFTGQANWYMKNQVLEALEDAGKSAGGAYDYLLTYTGADGESATLYSSEKFGGEGRIGGLGLHGAAASLDNYFFLEQMSGRTSGVVKLTVALEGESLVNDYQNTLATLEMDFATELVSTSGRRQDAVKTGDESNMMLFVVLLSASGLGLLISGCVMFGSRKKEAGEDAKSGRS